MTKSEIFLSILLIFISSFAFHEVVHLWQIRGDDFDVISTCFIGVTRDEELDVGSGLGIGWVEFEYNNNRVIDESYLEKVAYVFQVLYVVVGGILTGLVFGKKRGVKNG